MLFKACLVLSLAGCSFGNAIVRTVASTPDTSCSLAPPMVDAALAVGSLIGLFHAGREQGSENGPGLEQVIAAIIFLPPMAVFGTSALFGIQHSGRCVARAEPPPVPVCEPERSEERGYVALGVRWTGEPITTAGPRRLAATGEIGVRIPTTPLWVTGVIAGGAGEYHERSFSSLPSGGPFAQAHAGLELRGCGDAGCVFLGGWGGVHGDLGDQPDAIRGATLGMSTGFELGRAPFRMRAKLDLFRLDASPFTTSGLGISLAGSYGLRRTTAPQRCRSPLPD